jgi:hypothetical protein
MMSAAGLMLSAVVAASPLAQPAADGDRDPIRCRPAPYYVADRSGQPPKRTLQDAERRVRPCYLVTLKKKPLRVLV